MPRLPDVRTCACGCGLTFQARQGNYRHAPGHKPRKGQHYAAGERAQRKALFATLPNGAPCHWCGQPMTNAQRAAGQLISGHIVDRALGGAHKGLRYEHASCGKRAGAILGLELRRTDQRSRPW